MIPAEGKERIARVRSSISSTQKKKFGWGYNLACNRCYIRGPSERRFTFLFHSFQIIDAFSFLIVINFFNFLLYPLLIYLLTIKEFISQ